MPPAVLTDVQVADVLTFVRNSWNNGAARSLPGTSHLCVRSPDSPRSRVVRRQCLTSPTGTTQGFTIAEAARLTEFATRLTE